MPLISTANEKPSQGSVIAMLEPPGRLIEPYCVYRPLRAPTAACLRVPIRGWHRAANEGSRRDRLPPRGSVRGGSLRSPQARDVHIDGRLTLRAGHRDQRCALLDRKSVV